MPNQPMSVEPVYNEATGELQDLQVNGGTHHQAGTWTPYVDKGRQITTNTNTTDSADFSTTKTSVAFMPC